MSLQVGQVLRYTKDKNPEPQKLSGYLNYWNLTHLEGASRPLLEKGINPIASLSSPSGIRRPAILISSSPHKIGSAETPWHDIFDTDNGRIRYFGDAKIPGEDPAVRPGNKALLDAHAIHSAIEPLERTAATPIIFFKRVQVGVARKGYLAFQGFGIVEQARRVTQFDPRLERSFSNYVYDFAVLALANENETFDWRWINARRSAALDDAQCLTFAPLSWKKWVEGGSSALARTRRHVSKLLVSKREAQLPAPGSKSEQILKQVCSHYDSKKHHFEGLAYAIARQILSASGGHFVDGWVTQAGGDGGADFIGRLDIGEGFGAVRQVVYGQAKCIVPTSGVDGKDVARTVARLKRGWFGVFVTTSYFTEPVQREVIEDEYPILLISGLTVAQTVYQMMEENGYDDLEVYLDALDDAFEGLKARRRPEEILHT